MKPPKIKIGSEVMRELTMEVHIKRDLTFRLWLAKKLVHFAGWVAGFQVEDVDAEQDDAKEQIL